MDTKEKEELKDEEIILEPNPEYAWILKDSGVIVKAKKSNPRQFSSLYIENFRQFNRFSLNLSDPNGNPVKTMIIAGPNASGKTTLATLFGYFSSRQIQVSNTYTNFVFTIAPERLEFFNMIWQKIQITFPNSSWVIEDDIKLKIGEKTFPLASVSHGLASLFYFTTIITTCCFNNCATLIFDNPELHLDEQNQYVFLSTIKKFLPYTQLILATNSDVIWDQVYSFERTLLTLYKKKKLWAF